MPRFPIAEAIARCRWRQIVALARRYPLLAGLLTAAIAALPFAARWSATRAADSFRDLFAVVDGATLYAGATALVPALVASSWVARRVDVAERFPGLAVRGRRRSRLFAEAELGLYGPGLAVGALCAGPLALALAELSPGGLGAITAWFASSVAIAGVAGAFTEIGRATVRRSNVATLTLAAAAAWFVPPLLTGQPLSAGPAGAAGQALAGEGTPLAGLSAACGAAAVWGAVLRSLVAVPRQNGTLRTFRRSRSLPAGALRATTAALFREVTRTPRARASAASGFFLGVAGPLVLGELVPLATPVLLLIGVTTTGMTAAILASIAASRASVLRDAAPPARTTGPTGLVALILAAVFTAVSCGALLVLSGGTVSDVPIVLKPCVLAISATVVTTRIDLGADPELEQLRVAIYALLAAGFNAVAALLPVPLALAFGLAVVLAALAPRPRPRTRRRTLEVRAT